MSPQFKGYKVNPAATEPWVALIGKLLVNFGVVEFVSMAWLANLATDEIFVQTAAEFPLSRRIDLIKKLIRRASVPSDVKENAEQTWSELQGLAALRNHVAHNPIFFGWNSEKEEGPPDYIAIENLSAAIRGRRSAQRLTDITKLRAAVDRLPVLVTTLSALQDRWQLET